MDQAAERSVIVLRVGKTGGLASKTLQLGLEVNGQRIGSCSLSPVESQEAIEMADQFVGLFEQRSRLYLIQGYQEILGQGLFRIFLERDWLALQPLLQASNLLVVSSEIPEILGLPWELLSFPGLGPLGLDKGFDILRTPGPYSSLQPKSFLAPPPLRILFMACTSTGQAAEYERPERSFLQALSGMDVQLDVCDFGTWEELQRKVGELHPHLVHLSCQPLVVNGQGYLALEDDRGRAELRSSSDLGKMLTERGVQGVVLGGSLPDKGRPFTAVVRVCQGLIHAGVPVVIEGLMAEDLQASFLYGLYASLSKGLTADQALFLVRRDLKGRCEEGDSAWALPALFASSSKATLFDPSQETKLWTPSLTVHSPLPGIPGGFAAPFVGRRREISRLYPSLRDGSLRGVVITGPPGRGKTALATALALRLQGDGFRLISLDAGIDPFAPRLLEACSAAFRLKAYDLSSAGNTDDAAEWSAAADFMADLRASVASRVERILQALNRGMFLLVMDGLETNEEFRLKDPGASTFYSQILTQLRGNSRLVITADRLPLDLPHLPSGVVEEHLPRLSPSAVMRFLLKDKTVLDRYRKGELSGDLLLQISNLACTKYMEQIRALTGCLSPEELSELASLMPSQISAESDRICQDLLLSRLFKDWDLESRTALSRVSVLRIPLPMDALALVSGQGDIGPLLRRGEALALVYSTADGRASVGQQARTWLLERLDHEDLKEAHRMAGDLFSACSTLGLSRLDCLLEARKHYSKAEAKEQMLATTSRLSSLLERRGLYDDILKVNEGLDDPGPTLRRGLAHMHKGEIKRAEEELKRALDLYLELKDKSGQAVSLYSLGQILIQTKDYGRGQESLDRALSLQRDAEDKAGQAATLYALGLLEMKRQSLDQAKERFEEALAVQQKLKDYSSQGATQLSLATILLQQKDLEASRDRLRRALELYQWLGDSQGEASALDGLASLDLRREKFASALKKLRRVQKILSRLGNQQGEAVTWHNMGTAEVALGNRDSAQQSFRRALQIQQDLDDREGEAASLFQLGVLAVWKGKNDEALKLLAMAAMVLRATKSPDLKQVEPVVERLASQMKLSQDQFMAMVNDVVKEYRRDRGRGLVEAAFGNRV